MADPVVVHHQRQVSFSVNDKVGDFAQQDVFRAQVSFERIVFEALKGNQEDVPQLEEYGETWLARGVAVLSLGESAVKTVLSAVAFVIAYIADKVFGAEWNHEAYGEAVPAQFASFWRSGLMIVSPNAALASAFSTRQVPALDDKGQPIMVDNPLFAKQREADYVRAPMEADAPAQIQQMLDQQTPAIGRGSNQADAAIAWGTVGDLDQATWQEKAQLIGPIA